MNGFSSGCMNSRLGKESLKFALVLCTSVMHVFGEDCTGRAPGSHRGKTRLGGAWSLRGRRAICGRVGGRREGEPVGRLYVVERGRCSCRCSCSSTS